MLLKLWPDMVLIEDGMGNLPLHSLCKNVISDEETLVLIFWSLVDAHEEAIWKQNSMNLFAINILERRLNLELSRRADLKKEQEVGFTNPYEQNLHSIRTLHAKLDLLMSSKQTS